MKKIILSLIAVMACMSINAQVVKVYENGKLTQTYTNSSSNTVKVVFEEATTGTTNGHDWVKIGGVKWATMNVGATTVASSPSTCYGDYYAWGETTPRYTSISIASDGTSATFDWKSGYTYGYTSPNPTYTGNTLDADHDAATQNWGSDWRTPTNDDYVKLYQACGGTGSYIQGALPEGSTTTTDKGIYWCIGYDGVNGLLFSDGTNKVFFPAAGDCDGPESSAFGSYGFYRSSSLATGGTTNAYILYFHKKYLDPSSEYPCYYYGLTVRPVSD